MKNGGWYVILIRDIILRKPVSATGSVEYFKVSLFGSVTDDGLSVESVLTMKKVHIIVELAYHLSNPSYQDELPMYRGKENNFR